MPHSTLFKPSTFSHTSTSTPPAWPNNQRQCSPAGVATSPPSGRAFVPTSRRRRTPSWRCFAERYVDPVVNDIYCTAAAAAAAAVAAPSIRWQPSLDLEIFTMDLQKERQGYQHPGIWTFLPSRRPLGMSGRTQPRPWTLPER